jgi:RNA polymerase sigma-70 factor (ECF subfamily)
MSGADAALDFEPHRRHLTGLAYRMLGSVAEAEDVVQDAYLRWHGADRASVIEPRAFLARTVTRLCLDRLKSARVRRETYVGPWLPEPVLDTAPFAAGGGGDYAEDLSIALLLALERLSPLERAAFLLHDVFDTGFAEVARVLGRSEAACRQLAARARTHVRAARPRFDMPPDESARLVQAFAAAVATGETQALTRLLAEQARLHTDGGGKKLAARNIIEGADKIARFILGMARKYAQTPFREIRPARINGLPGFVGIEADGGLTLTAFETGGGVIAAIYLMRNPNKLRHLAIAAASR